MNTISNSELAHYKKKLLARQKEIQSLIEQHAHEEKPVDIDENQVGLLSRLEAMEEKALHEEIDHKREEELKRIEMALIRMKEGEYGFCLSCGEDIDLKRLKLDPSVTLCIDCAKP